MLLAPMTKTYRVGHLFCGIGAGAKGFNDAQPRIPGGMTARFECAGGVDVDAGAIKNFNRITGTRGTVLDLFDREQFTTFHGKEPPAGWSEATPADIRNAHGDAPLDVMFISAPCKGFSGLLSQKASTTEKYQALNRLTLRGIWLTLEAFKDDPVRIILFENVPRIQNRGRPLLDDIQQLLRAYGYVFAETNHDCGEIGGLAQSRKRFLMVARHPGKVPPFLYQPHKSRLRGVGEVIGLLPLPGDPLAGTMHRVPSLAWKTWVRLAFVPAGKDWRALNDLEVVDGVLAHYGILPDEQLRDNALGVLRWTDHAPTLTSQRAPGQGRFSVADPRIEGAHNEHLGVRGWSDPARVVAGATRPGNGAHSVADPRPTQDNQSFGQYGVKPWGETASTVTGQAGPGGGPNSVADPRIIDRTPHNNVFRIVAYDEPARSVTSAHGKGQCVADPRSATEFEGAGKYKVTAFDEPAGSVIGRSSTGQGAFAVADPRGGEDAAKLHGKHRVEKWDEASRAVIAGRDNGASAVADPRPAGLNAEDREGYSTQGHYGVVAWDDTAKAVPGHCKYDRGSWSVADPREGEGDAVAGMPGPDDRLVARIISTDNTWHRPFTTLELAALQSIFDPGEVFHLEGGSDQTKREWIGNAVPSAAARGMAETIGETLLLADSGESFLLSSREIWTRPLALALSVDPRQTIMGETI